MYSPSFLLPCWYINRNFITYRHLQCVSLSDDYDSKLVSKLSTTNPFAEDTNHVFLVQDDLYSPTYLPEFDETKFLRGIR